MSNTNNGGPAFPVADLSKNQCPGMSLRDYFAGKAMQAEILNCNNQSPDEGIAKWAYKMADAMLDARGEA